MALKSTRYQKVLPAAINRREIARRRVHLSGLNVGRRKKNRIRATILDVSIYGCRMELDAIFSPGETIQIHLADKAKIEANIVWQKAREVGCRFESPIDASVMKTLLSTN